MGMIRPNAPRSADPTAGPVPGVAGGGSAVIGGVTTVMSAGFGVCRLETARASRRTSASRDRCSSGLRTSGTVRSTAGPGALLRSPGELGLVATARDHFHQLLTDALRVLGPDHPHPEHPPRHRAVARRGRGSGRVASAFEQLLTDRLRVLGPDHPHTLTTRHHLAYFRGEAGDAVAAAAATFEQLLTDRLRVLGPDDSHTLIIRHNGTRWQGEAGDPAAAAAALEQLLTDRMRVLGPSHPDTLTTRQDIAKWRCVARKSTIRVDA
jgi:tetratricopeptide repeat protein